MKHLTSFILLLLLMCSCSKEPIDEESAFQKSTSEAASISQTVKPYFQVWISSIPDLTAPLIKIGTTKSGSISILSSGWIEGHSSHIKIIDPSRSNFRLTDCIYYPESNQLSLTLAGIIASEKGDSFNFTCNITVELSSSSLSGTMLIENGTGIFKNAKSILSTNGTFDFQSNTIDLVGEEALLP